MINLNILQKLPKSLKWYYLAKMIIPLFLIIIFLVSVSKGEVVYLMVGLLEIFLFFIVLPAWIILLLDYRARSFIMDNEKITINSGIVIKKSRTINFDRIQNTVITKGPLSALFGVSKLSIWTASPMQIQVKEEKMESNPDGVLWLKKIDAEALKEFFSRKHS